MSNPTSSYLSKDKDRQFKTVFFLLMVTGVLIYWVYMTLLEQYQPIESGHSAAMIFIIRMVQFKVLRHLLPLVIGWWLARSAALTLVEALYILPNRHIARTYLFNRHTPYNKGRAVLVKSDTLEKLRLENTTIRVGGPGLVQISGGEVAITERNGEVLNIHEAGIHYLEMLERIHTILILKPQTAELEGVELYTREYIPMTADIIVKFRVDTGDTGEDSDNPYPVDKDAVRKIVYAQNVGEDGTLNGWHARVKFASRFNLNKVIHRYSLSEIMFSTDVYANIHSELKPLIENALKQSGFNLMNVRVANIKPKDEAVSEQYMRFWKARQEVALHEQKATDEALYTLNMQVGKAEAELDMIEAIIEGVNNARRDGAVVDVRTAVSLRIIQAMEGLVARASKEQPVSPQLPQLLANLDALHQMQLHEQEK